MVNGYFETRISHRDVPACLYDSASLYIVVSLICFCYLLYTDYKMSEFCHKSTTQSVAFVSSIVAIILGNCMNTILFVSWKMFIDLCMTLISKCEDVYRK